MAACRVPQSLEAASLAGAGRISTGDRGILAGGGRFLAAVPWLPEPEPRVDGRGGSRTHQGPPTGPSMWEAGSREGRVHSTGGLPAATVLAHRGQAPPSRAGVADGNPSCVPGTGRWPPCGDSQSSSPVCPRVGSLRAAPRPPSGSRELATTEISTRHSGLRTTCYGDPADQAGASRSACVFKSQDTTGRGHRSWGVCLGAPREGRDGIYRSALGRNPDCGGRWGGRPGQASVAFRISRQLAPQREREISTEFHLATVRRTRGLLPRTRPLGVGGGHRGSPSPPFTPRAYQEGSG